MAHPVYNKYKNLLLGLFILLVGGNLSNPGSPTDTVEFISLDPKNNPVPDRYKNIKNFPVKIWRGGGVLFSHSKNLHFEILNIT
jgi:hypothetical protein